MDQKIRASVLVNNRSEGNAPLTAQALVDRVLTETSPAEHEF